MLGLAVITALGGGITRDVLIQKGPPLAFLDVRYLLVALGAGIVALLFGFSAGPHMSRFIWIADAASLGLFSVAGVSRALNAGLPVLAALILGLITAVGGGSLRDVLMGPTPRVFERGEPYAIAALLAVLVFLAGDRLGLDRSISTAAELSLGWCSNSWLRVFTGRRQLCASAWRHRRVLTPPECVRMRSESRFSLQRPRSTPSLTSTTNPGQWEFCSDERFATIEGLPVA